MKPLKIKFLLIIILLIFVVLCYPKDILKNYESYAFINIKRIIPYKNYLFVLNNSPKLCFSKTNSTNGNIIKKIILNGNGPKELKFPTDMDIYNNKIIIFGRYGKFFLYDIKSDQLSNLKVFKYNKKLGHINKISFIDNNTILISFYIFSTNFLNIENGNLIHWCLYNLKTKKISEIGIPYPEEIKKLKKYNTWLFFTHGVIDNMFFLSFKGSNYIYIYDNSEKKFIKKIKIPFKNYFGFKKVRSKIYGEGTKIPATFMDKGMKYKKNIIFLNGGILPINPQLLIIDKKFKINLIEFNINDYFKGNTSLNGIIFGNKLYYWENWGLIPRVSSGFVIKNLEL